MHSACIEQPNSTSSSITKAVLRTTVQAPMSAEKSLDMINSCMLLCSWNINGTMPKLGVIDTAQNNFSGVIPQGWGVPGLSFLVTKGI